MKTRKFTPLLVIGVGLLVYHNSFRNGFVFDDQFFIVENRHIRQLWPLWDIFTHSFRPMVSFSLAVNYALGRLNPWGYHVFNVGVHILAALILYGVVWRTLFSEPLRSKWAGEAPWLAGVVALIWLVHPLQTESVNYIWQRCESLVALFYLLTLYCVIRSSGSAHVTAWKFGAVASCALGMATKEVMATAPVMVLLYDRVFLAGSWREVWKRRWQVYAAFAATWSLLVALMATASSRMAGPPAAGFAYKGISPLQYALTQPGVIMHYLRLAFWPHPLCFDYGNQYGWPLVRTAGDALPDLMVVGALLAGTAWAWWRKPALGFLGVWFFVILAPTSSFVPIADLVVEHRMYLPLAAVVAMVTVGGFALGRDLLSTRPQTQRMLGWGVSLALVLLLAILTIQRNRDYSSGLVLWQDTVVKCPNSPRAHYNLGNALLQAGKLQEAIRHYEQAVEIKPDYQEAHNNLALILMQAGNMDDAIRHLAQAVQANPNSAEGHCNLANALMRANRLEEAMEHYEQAVLLKPDFAEAHHGLGVLLDRKGHTQDAIQEYRQALRFEPNYAEVLNDLGLALASQGKLDEAIPHLLTALRLKPNYAEAHYNIGLLLAKQGRLETAISHLQSALTLEPNSEKYSRAFEALQRVRMQAKPIQQDHLYGQ